MFHSQNYGILRMTAVISSLLFVSHMHLHSNERRVLELVPFLPATLHAWMSSVEPQQISVLDHFVRSLHLMNKEQIYAAWPAGLRRRLVKAADVHTIDRNRASSMRQLPSAVDIELSSAANEGSSNDRGIGSADLRSSLLGLDQTKERNQFDRAQHQFATMFTTCHLLEATFWRFRQVPEK